MWDLPVFKGNGSTATCLLVDVSINPGYDFNQNKNAGIREFPHIQDTGRQEVGNEAGEFQQSFGFKAGADYGRILGWCAER